MSQAFGPHCSAAAGSQGPREFRVAVPAVTHLDSRAPRGPMGPERHNKQLGGPRMDVEAARCPVLPAHAGQETLPACGSQHSIHWRLLTNRILPGHGPHVWGPAQRLEAECHWESRRPDVRLCWGLSFLGRTRGTALCLSTGLQQPHGRFWPPPVGSGAGTWVSSWSTPPALHVTWRSAGDR